MLKTSLLLMKHIFDSDLPEKLPGIMKLLRELSDKKTALEYLETMLKYLSSGSSVDRKILKEAIHESFADEGGGIMQTLAEQWIEQGMQQGIQQGLRQGIQRGIKDGQLQNSREMLVETLEIRFDMVPGSIFRTIQNIHEIGILKRLHKKAVVSESLDQFRNALKILME